jgi:DNA-binding GntR family transcriptional regulator
MRSIYQVRGALDELAARLAAQRRTKLDAKLIEQGRKAARGRNVKAMIDADLAFHQAVYAASGNPLIAQTAQQHWQHLRRVMGAVLREVRQREAVWDEHEAIAKAIAAGDGDKAARLIGQHSQRASDNLALRLDQVLKTQGDRS